MTPKPPKVRVLDPGGFSPDDWNVAGAIVEHERLPGWRFTISLSLRDGRVLGLGIEPTTTAAFERGVTTAALLRVLPLDDLRAAVRAANAQRFLGWTEPRPTKRLEVNDEGRVVSVLRGELVPNQAMRAAMREVAEPIRRNPRDRKTRQRLTDVILAQEMDVYARAVASGISVANIARSLRMSVETLREHREEATRRGLFESAGRGRAGGALTPKGIETRDTKEPS
jgi:hypothetical protein